MIIKINCIIIIVEIKNVYSKNSSMVKKIEDKNKVNLDTGHRERLRNFIINNYETATKEKVFEYFLCMAIPRRDVRLLSKTILEKFNYSINSLINKDYNYLKNSMKLSEAIIGAIFTFRKLMTFCNEEELVEENKLDSITKLARYFQKEIGSRDTEYIIVLFLNSAQKLIEKRVFGDKNSSLTTFDIGEIVNIALNNNTRYIVLSHNHPSGNVQPSPSDKNTTHAFEETIKNMNKFELVDHIIVSAKKYYSFYEHNLLNNIYRTNVNLSDNSNKITFYKE